MNTLAKYSFGTGDRFGQEGEAQLEALKKAQKEFGVTITPVWNKSNREHQIIGTEPSEVRKEADSAVKALSWTGSYFVDADHINLKTVDRFLDHSDFFTLDVAEHIGKPAGAETKKEFLNRNKSFIGEVKIEGIADIFSISDTYLGQWADQYLLALNEAAKLYQYIHSKKQQEGISYEISIDEVDAPQTPIDLFFILKTVADLKIPLNTIAPKFTGDFFKGVDYVGNIDQFTKEFEQDILVIRHAVKDFGLPENLKLSVHSGSDKFSIYKPIQRLVRKYDAGLHLKTAGTTWLEELIGLAAADGEGLKLATSIYRDSFKRLSELTAPYATVINISENELPDPEVVAKWSSDQFVHALAHEQSNPAFNQSFRQLLHCGYKIAAEKGSEFMDALVEHRKFIFPQVTYNLYERHLKPLFSE